MNEKEIQALRRLGVFWQPPSHLVGQQCPVCHNTFGPTTHVGLKPIETPDETGELTVRAEVVCATCYLKYEEVMTPIGGRIVNRVKEGDASPYLIVTTDGNQWKPSEVSR